MKLSQELKLRGAVVGDTYGRDKYGGTGWVVTYSTKIYSSLALEEILSGRHDEAGNFLWLRDKDGIKKEITKEAIEGDGMGCIIGVCNALAFTAVVVVVVFLLLGLLGN